MQSNSLITRTLLVLTGAAYLAVAGAARTSATWRTSPATGDAAAAEQTGADAAVCNVTVFMERVALPHDVAGMADAAAQIPVRVHVRSNIGGPSTLNRTSFQLQTLLVPAHRSVAAWTYHAQLALQLTCNESYNVTLSFTVRGVVEDLQIELPLQVHPAARTYPDKIVSSELSEILIPLTVGCNSNAECIVGFRPGMSPLGDVRVQCLLGAPCTTRSDTHLDSRTITIRVNGSCPCVRTRSWTLTSCNTSLGICDSASVDSYASTSSIQPTPTTTAIAPSQPVILGSFLRLHVPSDVDVSIQWFPSVNTATAVRSRGNESSGDNVLINIPHDVMDYSARLCILESLMVHVNTTLGAHVMPLANASRSVRETCFSFAFASRNCNASSEHRWTSSTSVLVHPVHLPSHEPPTVLHGNLMVQAPTVHCPIHSVCTGACTVENQVAFLDVPVAGSGIGALVQPSGATASSAPSIAWMSSAVAVEVVGEPTALHVAISPALPTTQLRRVVATWCAFCAPGVVWAPDFLSLRDWVPAPNDTADAFAAAVSLQVHGFQLHIYACISPGLACTHELLDLERNVSELMHDASASWSTSTRTNMQVQLLIGGEDFRVQFRVPAVSNVGHISIGVERAAWMPELVRACMEDAAGMVTAAVLNGASASALRAIAHRGSFILATDADGQVLASVSVATCNTTHTMSLQLVRARGVANTMQAALAWLEEPLNLHRDGAASIIVLSQTQLRRHGGATRLPCSDMWPALAHSTFNTGDPCWLLEASSRLHNISNRSSTCEGTLSLQRSRSDRCGTLLTDAVLVPLWRGGTFVGRWMLLAATTSPSLVHVCPHDDLNTVICTESPESSSLASVAGHFMCIVAPLASQPQLPALSPTPFLSCPSLTLETWNDTLSSALSFNSAAVLVQGGLVSVAWLVCWASWTTCHNGTLSLAWESSSGQVMQYHQRTHVAPAGADAQVSRLVLFVRCGNESTPCSQDVCENGTEYMLTGRTIPAGCTLVGKMQFRDRFQNPVACRDVDAGAWKWHVGRRCNASLTACELRCLAAEAGTIRIGATLSGRDLSGSPAFVTVRAHASGNTIAYVSLPLAETLKAGMPALVTVTVYDAWNNTVELVDGQPDGDSVTFGMAGADQSARCTARVRFNASGPTNAALAASAPCVTPSGVCAAHTLAMLVTVNVSGLLHVYLDSINGAACGQLLLHSASLTPFQVQPGAPRFLATDEDAPSALSGTRNVTLARFRIYDAFGNVVNELSGLLDSAVVTWTLMSSVYGSEPGVPDTPANASDAVVALRELRWSTDVVSTSARGYVEVRGTPWLAGVHAVSICAWPSTHSPAAHVNAACITQFTRVHSASVMLEQSLVTLDAESNSLMVRLACADRFGNAVEWNACRVRLQAENYTASPPLCTVSVEWNTSYCSFPIMANASATFYLLAEAFESQPDLLVATLPWPSFLPATSHRRLRVLSQGLDFVYTLAAWTLRNDQGIPLRYTPLVPNTTTPLSDVSVPNAIQYAYGWSNYLITLVTHSDSTVHQLHFPWATAATDADVISTVLPLPAPNCTCVATATQAGTALSLITGLMQCWQSLHGWNGTLYLDMPQGRVVYTFTVGRPLYTLNVSLAMSGEWWLDVILESTTDASSSDGISTTDASSLDGIYLEWMSPLVDAGPRLFRPAGMPRMLFVQPGKKDPNSSFLWIADGPYLQPNSTYVMGAVLTDMWGNAIAPSSSPQLLVSMDSNRSQAQLIIMSSCGEIMGAHRFLGCWAARVLTPQLLTSPTLHVSWPAENLTALAPIYPGPPAAIRVALQNSTSRIVAGQPIAVVITAEDAFGNALRIIDEMYVDVHLLRVDSPAAACHVTACVENQIDSCSWHAVCASRNAGAAVVTISIQRNATSLSTSLTVDILPAEADAHHSVAAYEWSAYEPAVMPERLVLAPHDVHDNPVVCTNLEAWVCWYEWHPINGSLPAGCWRVTEDCNGTHYRVPLTKSPMHQVAVGVALMPEVYFRSVNASLENSAPNLWPDSQLRNSTARRTRHTPSSHDTLTVVVQPLTPSYERSSCSCPSALHVGALHELRCAFRDDFNRTAIVPRLFANDTETVTSQAYCQLSTALGNVAINGFLCNETTGICRVLFSLISGSHPMTTYAPMNVNCRVNGTVGNVTTRPQLVWLRSHGHSRAHTSSLSLSMPQAPQTQLDARFPTIISPFDAAAPRVELHAALRDSDNMPSSKYADDPLAAVRITSPAGAYLILLPRDDSVTTRWCALATENASSCYRTTITVAMDGLDNSTSAFELLTYADAEHFLASTPVVSESLTAVSCDGQFPSDMSAELSAVVPFTELPMVCASVPVAVFRAAKIFDRNGYATPISSQRLHALLASPSPFVDAQLVDPSGARIAVNLDAADAQEMCVDDGMPCTSLLLGYAPLMRDVLAGDSYVLLRHATQGLITQRDAATLAPSIPKALAVPPLITQAVLLGALISGATNATGAPACMYMWPVSCVEDNVPTSQSFCAVLDSGAMVTASRTVTALTAHMPTEVCLSASQIRNMSFGQHFLRLYAIPAGINCSSAALSEEIRESPFVFQVADGFGVSAVMTLIVGAGGCGGRPVVGSNTSLVVVLRDALRSPVVDSAIVSSMFSLSSGTGAVDFTRRFANVSVSVLGNGNVTISYIPRVKGSQRLLVYFLGMALGSATCSITPSVGAFAPALTPVFGVFTAADASSFGGQDVNTEGSASIVAGTVSSVVISPVDVIGNRETYSGLAFRAEFDAPAPLLGWSDTDAWVSASPPPPCAVVSIVAVATIYTMRYTCYRAGWYNMTIRHNATSVPLRFMPLRVQVLPGRPAAGAAIAAAPEFLMTASCAAVRFRLVDDWGNAHVDQLPTAYVAKARPQVRAFWLIGASATAEDAGMASLLPAAPSDTFVSALPSAWMPYAGGGWYETTVCALHPAPLVPASRPVALRLTLTLQDEMGSISTVDLLRNPHGILRVHWVPAPPSATHSTIVPFSTSSITAGVPFRFRLQLRDRLGYPCSNSSQAALASGQTTWLSLQLIRLTCTTCRYPVSQELPLEILSPVGAECIFAGAIPSELTSDAGQLQLYAGFGGYASTNTSAAFLVIGGAAHLPNVLATFRSQLWSHDAAPFASLASWRLVDQYDNPANSSHDALDGIATVFPGVCLDLPSASARSVVVSCDVSQHCHVEVPVINLAAGWNCLVMNWTVVDAASSQNQLVSVYHYVHSPVTTSVARVCGAASNVSVVDLSATPQIGTSLNASLLRVVDVASASSIFSLSCWQQALGVVRCVTHPAPQHVVIATSPALLVVPPRSCDPPPLPDYHLVAESRGAHLGIDGAPVLSLQANITFALHTVSWLRIRVQSDTQLVVLSRLPDSTTLSNASTWLGVPVYVDTQLPPFVAITLTWTAMRQLPTARNVTLTVPRCPHAMYGPGSRLLTTAGPSEPIMLPPHAAQSTVHFSACSPSQPTPSHAVALLGNRSVLVAASDFVGASMALPILQADAINVTVAVNSSAGATTALVPVWLHDVALHTSEVCIRQSSWNCAPLSQEIEWLLPAATPLLIVLVPRDAAGRRAGTLLGQWRWFMKTLTPGNQSVRDNLEFYSIGAGMAAGVLAPIQSNATWQAELSWHSVRTGLRAGRVGVSIRATAVIDPTMTKRMILFLCHSVTSQCRVGASCMVNCTWIQHAADGWLPWLHAVAADSVTGVLTASTVGVACSNSSACFLLNSQRPGTAQITIYAGFVAVSNVVDVIVVAGPDVASSRTSYVSLPAAPVLVGMRTTVNVTLLTDRQELVLPFAPGCNASCEVHVDTLRTDGLWTGSSCIADVNITRSGVHVVSARVSACCDGTCTSFAVLQSVGGSPALLLVKSGAPVVAHSNLTLRAVSTGASDASSKDASAAASVMVVTGLVLDVYHNPVAPQAHLQRRLSVPNASYTVHVGHEPVTMQLYDVVNVTSILQLRSGCWHVQAALSIVADVYATGSFCSGAPLVMADSTTTTAISQTDNSVWIQLPPGSDYGNMCADVQVSAALITDAEQQQPSGLSALLAPLTRDVVSSIVAGCFTNGSVQVLIYAYTGSTVAVHVILGEELVAATTPVSMGAAAANIPRHWTLAHAVQDPDAGFLTHLISTALISDAMCGFDDNQTLDPQSATCFVAAQSAQVLLQAASSWLRISNVSGLISVASGMQLADNELRRLGYDAIAMNTVAAVGTAICTRIEPHRCFHNPQTVMPNCSWANASFVLLEHTAHTHYAATAVMAGIGGWNNVQATGRGDCGALLIHLLTGVLVARAHEAAAPLTNYSATPSVTWALSASSATSLRAPSCPASSACSDAVVDALGRWNVTCTTCSPQPYLQSHNTTASLRTSHVSIVSCGYGRSWCADGRCVTTSSAAFLLGAAVPSDSVVIDSACPPLSPLELVHATAVCVGNQGVLCDDGACAMDVALCRSGAVGDVSAISALALRAALAGNVTAALLLHRSARLAASTWFTESMSATMIEQVGQHPACSISTAFCNWTGTCVAVDKPCLPFTGITLDAGESSSVWYSDCPTGSVLCADGSCVHGPRCRPVDSCSASTPALCLGGSCAEDAAACRPLPVALNTTGGHLQLSAAALGSAASNCSHLCYDAFARTMTCSDAVVPAPRSGAILVSGLSHCIHRAPLSYQKPASQGSWLSGDSNVSATSPLPRSLGAHTDAYDSRLPAWQCRQGMCRDTALTTVPSNFVPAAAPLTSSASLQPAAVAQLLDGAVFAWTPVREDVLQGSWQEARVGPGHPFRITVNAISSRYLVLWRLEIARNVSAAAAGTGFQRGEVVTPNLCAAFVTPFGDSYRCISSANCMSGQECYTWIVTDIDHACSVSVLQSVLSRSGLCAAPMSGMFVHVINITAPIPITTPVMTFALQANEGPAPSTTPSSTASPAASPSTSRSQSTTAAPTISVSTSQVASATSWMTSTATLSHTSLAASSSGMPSVTATSSPSVTTSLTHSISASVKESASPSGAVPSVSASATISQDSTRPALQTSSSFSTTSTTASDVPSPDASLTTSSTATSYESAPLDNGVASRSVTGTAASAAGASVPSFLGSATATASSTQTSAIVAASTGAATPTASASATALLHSSTVAAVTHNSPMNLTGVLFLASTDSVSSIHSLLLGVMLPVLLGTCCCGAVGAFLMALRWKRETAMAEDDEENRGSRAHAAAESGQHGLVEKAASDKHAVTQKQAASAQLASQVRAARASAGHFFATTSALRHFQRLPRSNGGDKLPIGPMHARSGLSPGTQRITRTEHWTTSNPLLLDDGTGTLPERGRHNPHHLAHRSQLHAGSHTRAVVVPNDAVRASATSTPAPAANTAAQQRRTRAASITSTLLPLSQPTGAQVALQSAARSASPAVRKTADLQQRRQRLLYDANDPTITPQQPHGLQADKLGQRPVHARGQDAGVGRHRSATPASNEHMQHTSTVTTNTASLRNERTHTWQSRQMTERPSAGSTVMRDSAATPWHSRLREEALTRLGMAPTRPRSHSGHLHHGTRRGPSNAAMPMDTHPPSQMHAHAGIDGRTHTHTHSHASTHKHSHTSTHTRAQLMMYRTWQPARPRVLLDDDDALCSPSQRMLHAPRRGSLAVSRLSPTHVRALSQTHTHTHSLSNTDAHTHAGRRAHLIRTVQLGQGMTARGATPRPRKSAH